MRHATHKLICWYLRRCAGAFHCYNYGETGRYVVLMDEDQYHRYAKLARTPNAKLTCGEDRKFEESKVVW